MKPLKDRLLAEVLPEPENESGIILIKKKQYFAKVLFIGPNVSYLKVGDRIMYDPNDAIKMDYEGKKCVFLQENIGSLFLMENTKEHDILPLTTEFHKNSNN